MQMQSLFTIVLVVLGLLLMTAILLQAKGAGLGAAFGGDGYVARSRRGAEKRLHQITIVLAILFFGVALAHVLI